MKLRNFTHNLRMFLDIFDPSLENKTLSSGKTLEIFWCQIFEKMAMFVHKII